jgi:hypothetical protein
VEKIVSVALAVVLALISYKPAIAAPLWQVAVLWLN